MRFSSTLSLTSALDGVDGQRHAPVALPREREQLPILYEDGWAPGLVWTSAENLAPQRDSIPGPSSPWRVAIPTELSRPTRRATVLATPSTLDLKEKATGSQNLIRSEEDTELAYRQEKLHDRDGKFVLNAWLEVGEISVRKLEAF